jgi:hypothetical protein
MIHDPIQAARDLVAVRSHLHNIRDLLRSLALTDAERALDNNAMCAAIQAVTALAADCDPDTSHRAYIDHARDAARHARAVNSPTQ